MSWQFLIRSISEILLKTNPLNFVYVELNAVLQSNSNILSQMFLMKKDQANYIYYKEMAHRFQVGINAVSMPIQKKLKWGFKWAGLYMKKTIYYNLLNFYWNLTQLLKMRL